MRTRSDENGRVCTKCLIYKLWSEFYANPKGENGYYASCKKCHKKNGKTARRVRDLDNRYGLTEFEYELMFEKQNGVCAICQNPPKQGTILFVDHCHKTGINRGLLCNGCNAQLAFVEKYNFEIQQYLLRNNNASC